LHLPLKLRNGFEVDLSRIIDGFKAVDDLSLTIDHEELRVVIGPMVRERPHSSI